MNDELGRALLSLITRLLAAALPDHPPAGSHAAAGDVRAAVLVSDDALWAAVRRWEHGEDGDLSMMEVRAALASSRPEPLDAERLARALDAPGVFDAPLDDAIGLAHDIAREYDRLGDTDAPGE